MGSKASGALRLVVSKTEAFKKSARIREDDHRSRCMATAGYPNLPARNFQLMEIVRQRAGENAAGNTSQERLAKVELEIAHDDANCLTADLDLRIAEWQKVRVEVARRSAKEKTIKLSQIAIIAKVDGNFSTAHTPLKIKPIFPSKGNPMKLNISNMLSDGRRRSRTTFPCGIAIIEIKSTNSEGSRNTRRFPLEGRMKITNVKRRVVRPKGQGAFARRCRLGLVAVASSVFFAAPARAADDKSGYTGCYASSFIRIYHESNVTTTYYHYLDGGLLQSNASNVGVYYTGVRNGTWRISVPYGSASLFIYQGTCY